MGEEQRLESLHDPRSLHGVRLRSDEEIYFGSGNSEIAEEGAGELVVIVLPGVNDDLFGTNRCRSPIDGGELRKVRAGTNDVKKTHVSSKEKTSNGASSRQRRAQFKSCAV